jgi:hypothetical protein
MWKDAVMPKSTYCPQIVAFWFLASCSLGGGYQWYGGLRYLHLQIRIVVICWNHMDSTPASYSGGLWFKSQPENMLSGLRHSWLFWVPLEMRLKLLHDRYLPLFSMYSSRIILPVRCYFYSDLLKALLNTPQITVPAFAWRHRGNHHEISTIIVCDMSQIWNTYLPVGIA